MQYIIHTVKKFTSLFSDVSINVENVQKFLGIPVIIQMADDLEDEEDGRIYSGVMTDIKDNIIYLDNSSEFRDDLQNWEEMCWDDFRILDPKREDPLSFAKRDIIRLENVQHFYVSKQKSTLEQLQDMWVDPGK